MKKTGLMLKLLYFIGGMFVINIGKGFIISASLGTDPWNVLYIGAAKLTPLSVGRVNQIIGAIMLIIGWSLKITPTIGTFANMYLFGFFLDFILGLNLIKPPQGMVMSLFYLILGTVISGVGFGIYLNGKLGAGPRDSFMLGVSQATGAKPGLIKAIMEGTVVSIGWLLGGPVGLGTIVYVALIGPIMQWSLDLIKLPKRFETPASSG